MTNKSTVKDSNLGLREYPVHLALAPFVKCIWSQESGRAIFDGGRERILPDSCVELVIHFRDPFLTHFADGTSAVQPQGFVAGQMKRFLEISLQDEWVSLRFVSTHAGRISFFKDPSAKWRQGSSTSKTFGRRESAR